MAAEERVRLAEELRHRRGLGEVALAFAILLLLASPPLGADCECAVSVTTADLTWTSTSTSTGACNKTTLLTLFRDEIQVGHKDCGITTACTSETTRSTACLRTGTHPVRLHCGCGKLGTDVHGNPICDFDSGDDQTGFFVNTTPTVGVEVEGPDVTGDVEVTAPYSFPNTPNPGERDLELFADGFFRLGSSNETPGGTYTFPTLSTACWKQGPHEIKVVATACHQGDPLFKDQAAQQIEVDHDPEIDFRLLPLPDGRFEAVTDYFFPQTNSTLQRFLDLRAFPSGAIFGQLNPSREGTWSKIVSCNGGKNRLLILSAQACTDIKEEHRAALPGCPKPPRVDGCGDEEERCEDCSGPPAGGLGGGGGGGGGGVPVGGGGPAVEGGGPGARLSYLAGGAGSPGNPGQAAWNTILGRGWSHDYAERVGPDPLVANRVWLITRHGSFRRFTDGNNDGFYEARWPETEKRRLTKLGTTGWELRHLDGTVQSFDAAGLWLRTEDRSGNAKTAIYASGHLAAVAMPDGRSEEFSYHPDGKLAAITEVGVGGAPERSWQLSWSGDDLVQIDRPDGTALRFTYGSLGWMTRRILVAADDGDPLTPRPERVEGAWDYDGEGNVLRAWRGADDFASGVDRYEFAYDNPFEPEQTTVTIHRSDTERDTVVYTLSRTAKWVGGKARVTSISGDCTSCGLGPNSQIFYDDPQNPLLPTQIIDGRGIETHFFYDANGQLIEKVEAAGTPESSATSWTYGDPTFPTLPTRVEVPSTAGGAALRTTLFSYDAQGNSTGRREQGVEAGAFFDLETATTFNAAGQPLTTDPPGHGTTDVTSFTHDPARGGLLPLTRTDPLVGTTSFEHDPFNRRIAITDPNGLRAETVYDAGNRVLAVIQLGSTAADDLVTAHAYNAFGELVRTTLPRGNVIEHSYDPAGRMVSVERKPDAATPGDRTVYTLDGLGNRVREEHQRWNGSGWETRSFTEFVYQNRCQLQKIAYADGTVTEHSYDCAGNLEKVWDANHSRLGGHEPTQVYEYDALNRLVRVRQPWTGAGGGEALTSYEYDVQDHLVAVTDAEGNETTYLYSDRDLMARQVSPVSGTTTSTYGEHGELLSETDARGLTVARTVDALGRLTFLNYLDPALDTTYTYDDPSVPFSRGRLTAITRGGHAVTYRYDRFGRTLQDGELVYRWDGNGNRVEVGYPGEVVARYGHDFADREASLELVIGSGAPQAIVSAATYEPPGPLSGVTLGNGLTETREHNARYGPTRIAVPPHLDLAYSTDSVGNILAESGTVLGRHHDFAYTYQDVHYFLTGATGPWGDRAWSYDRIGNRLSESRGSGAPLSAYSYLPATGGGNSPALHRIEPAPEGDPGSAQVYTFDPVGNLAEIAHQREDTTARRSLFTSGADGRLSGLATTDGPGSTALAYDGRGFLRRSRLTFAGSTDFTETEPVYSSEGLLLGRSLQQRTSRGGDQDDGEPAFEVTTEQVTYLLYFAGRPVAQLAHPGSGEIDDLLYLTTDHLGTPFLATDPAGTAVWAGGVEPFGAFLELRQATPGEGDQDAAGAAARVGGLGSLTASSQLPSDRIFLRYPGQWDDASWRSHAIGGGLYHNVHRWYDSSTGRYTQVDPITSSAADSAGPRYYPFSIEPYLYASNQPLRLIDPLGLASVDALCAVRWFLGGAAAGAAAGCALGGALTTPGGVTIPAGCTIGASVGARGGAAGGAILGLLNCKCEPKDRDQPKQDCYQQYINEAGRCGSLYTDDYDYERCMSRAWANYLRCLNGLPPKPFVP